MISRRHPATSGPPAAADVWSALPLSDGGMHERPAVGLPYDGVQGPTRYGMIHQGRKREPVMARLLVIEDRKKLLNSLRRGLEEEGYEVVAAATGEQGYYAATTEDFDAVVLDLMLPGRDGLQVLRDLRANGFGRPVLILTARDTVEDRVHGLDGGADDYLTKPFAFAELLARLRALLRRGASGRETILRADDLEMDLLARRVVRGGVELDLTRREFELLEYLLRHKDATVTREMIAREVWKDAGGMLTNTIDVYVTLLRKKVERPGGKQLIHTLRGVGYALRDGS
jgi:two-component system copper resistance phosphate regulon response regulator CusR